MRNVNINERLYCSFRLRYPWHLPYWWNRLTLCGPSWTTTLQVCEVTNKISQVYNYRVPRPFLSVGYICLWKQIKLIISKTALRSVLAVRWQKVANACLSVCKKCLLVPATWKVQFWLRRLRTVEFLTALVLPGVRYVLSLARNEKTFF